jgi:hypothetical protein
VTILVMGFSTFAVGLLPTYASVGWLAPDPDGSACGLLQGLRSGGDTAAQRLTSPSTRRPASAATTRLDPDTATLGCSSRCS